MRRVLYYNHGYMIRKKIFPVRKIHTMILRDEDDRANIYVEERDSEAQQRRSLKHEVIHYVMDDHHWNWEIAETHVREIEGDTRIIFCEND